MGCKRKNFCCQASNKLYMHQSQYRGGLSDWRDLMRDTKGGDWEQGSAICLKSNLLLAPCHLWEIFPQAINIRNFIIIAPDFSFFQESDSLSRCSLGQPSQFPQESDLVRNKSHEFNLVLGIAFPKSLSLKSNCIFSIVFLIKNSLN